MIEKRKNRMGVSLTPFFLGSGFFLGPGGGNIAIILRLAPSPPPSFSVVGLLQTDV